MDTEQIPVMENKEPMVVSEPMISTPEPVEGKPSKSSPVIMILVILVIALIGGLAYFVLKDRGINLLSGIVEDTATSEDTTTTDNDDIEATQQCITDSEGKECVLTLANAGWGLFSVPEYQFSTEIPSYSLNQTVLDEELHYKWTTWFSTNPTFDDGHEWLYLLSNKMGTVSATFWAVPEPKIVTGNPGRHQIYVNIFENTEKKSLESEINVYRAAWEKEFVNTDVPSTNLKGSVVSKFGTSAWSFESSTEGGTWNGYLVANDSYIYEVKYQLSTTPAGSYQIALKVLDSMKFGE